MRYSANVEKGLDLPVSRTVKDMKFHNLACHSFMGPGRGHETPGLETFITVHRLR